MISMYHKQEIILRYFREGDSVRKICRDLGIHRDTVQRYLTEYLQAKKASEQTGVKEVLHRVVSEPPGYRLTTARAKKKLTQAVTDAIDGYLSENERKTRAGEAKQRMRGCDIHQAVRSLGHDVGYTTVCVYIQERTHVVKEAFIRQEYLPGMVCEFDWAEVKLVLGGRQRRVYMALFAFAYSNYRYGMLFHRQDQLAFMECHRAFYSHIGGVPQEMVYDNMRVAVSQFVGKNEKRPTQALVTLAGWYHYRWRFCNVRKGNEKGHVERGVEMVRRKAFSGTNVYETLEQAAAQLTQTCEMLNAAGAKAGDSSPTERLEVERQVLFAHPGAIECFYSQDHKVDKYATICMGTNRYSVPDHLVGRMVAVKIYSEQLRIYHDDRLLATHSRSYERNLWVIHMDHYLVTLSRKPGALAGSVALRQAPAIIGRLYATYFSDQARAFLDLLSYCKDQEISPEVLQEAVYEVQTLCPKDVSVDKVRVILGNQPNQTKVIPINGTIETHALQQLQALASLMKQS